MAESEKELKSLLMIVKEESEKTGLKLNFQKAKIMASSPITSWQIDAGKKRKQWQTFFLGLQNHCRWCKSCLTLCNLTDYTLNGILQARIWIGQPFPSSGDLPNPGLEPRFPALQADSLPAESQGKSKKAGVSSLSLLQQIFLTQELNQGLLNCRWILY